MPESGAKVAKTHGTDDPQIGGITAVNSPGTVNVGPHSSFRLDLWAPAFPGQGSLNISGAPWGVTLQIRGGQKLFVPIFPGSGMSFPPGLVLGLSATIGTNAGQAGQSVLLWALVPPGSPPTFPNAPQASVDLTTFPTPTGSTNFAPYAGVLTVLYKGSAAGGALSVASNGANLAAYHYAAAVIVGETVGPAGLIVLKIPVVAGLGITITDAGGAGTILAASLGPT